MTPQHQREYCIGCGNCVIEGMSRNRPRCKITRWFLDMFDVQVMISTIGCKHNTRSRPAPSAPTFCDKVGGGYECAGVQKVGLCPREATIRNQMLDALERDFKWRYVEDAVAEIRRFPESLRSEVPE